MAAREDPWRLVIESCRKLYHLGEVHTENKMRERLLVMSLLKNVQEATMRPKKAEPLSPEQIRKERWMKSKSRMAQRRLAVVQEDFDRHTRSSSEESEDGESEVVILEDGEYIQEENNEVFLDEVEDPKSQVVSISVTAEQGKHKNVDGTISLEETTKKNHRHNPPSISSAKKPTVKPFSTLFYLAQLEEVCV